jgi:hypothetical protein
MECVHKYAWFMAKWDVAGQKIEVTIWFVKLSTNQRNGSSARQLVNYAAY